MESGSGGSATAAADGWLSKRRKLHTAAADLSSTQTVVSRLVNHTLCTIPTSLHF